MSDIATLKQVFDHVAKGRETTLTAFGTGHRLWHCVDGAGDETFENAMGGELLSAVDASLEGGMPFDYSPRTSLFTRLESYLINEGYSRANGHLLSQYLTAVGG